MQRVRRYGTAVVILHAIVLAPHALAHQAIPVVMPPVESAFIALVIVLAPLVAAGLLWTRLAWAGAGLLLASMGGSLAFGLYYHFLLLGPDNVVQAPADRWGLLFQASAVLLAVTEALGCWVAGWILALTRIRTGHPRAVEAA